MAKNSCAKSSNGSSKPVKKGYVGASCCCQQCRQIAQFQRYRSKEIVSLFGPLDVPRAYYHGCDCGGTFPGDPLFGLGRRKITPAVQQLTTLAGTLLSFPQASWALAKFCGLTLSEPTVRRITEEVGTAAATEQAQGLADPPAERFAWGLDRQGKRCGCASLDGVHVPLQGPDGTAAESRVAYLGRVWELTAEPEQTGRRRLVGAFSLETCQQALSRQADRVGGQQVEQWILPSDAGAGLESRLCAIFPFSNWILDFYHAQEHLRELTSARHADPELATREQHRLRHLLRHAGGAALLRELEGKAAGLNSISPAQPDVAQREQNYFARHVHGMDYPRYAARGWPLGSGPMESGCKEVVTARMKQSGMRWSLTGAQALLALRLVFCNGPRSWDARWERAATDN